MSRTTSKITGMLAASLLAAALVPATSSAFQDQRSADAVDSGVVHARSDYQDQRSADARDTSVSASSLSPAQGGGSSEGVGWGDVRLIGGGVLCLALIGLGGRALFVRHARTVQKSRAPAVSS